MKEFYEHFMSSDSIELKNDVAAEHGLPTDDAEAGGPCEELNPPFYVNNCHYSGARHILNKVCRYAKAKFEVSQSRPLQGHFPC